MAEILKGAPVVEALVERNKEEVLALKSKGINPTLAILRVGERPDDLAYEKSAMKRAEKVGVDVRVLNLPQNVDQDTLNQTIESLNKDPKVHGILMFRPLPKHLDGEMARELLVPEKDMDGCTDGSLAGVFVNRDLGYPPCCPEAALEILDYYNIPVAGKKVAVIGRSLVIGKPVAMMLMHRNATVVNCHTATMDIPSITREADILIVAAGSIGMVDEKYVNPDQVIIDIGINWDEEKNGLSGDVDFERVEPIVKAITPVPGGVGTVTASVLISHVVQAAKKSIS